MSKVDLRDFESKLLEWKQTLQRQLRPTGTSADDPDPLARQSAEMVDSLDNLWRQALVAQTREIDQALERIQKGKFGICEQCSGPISPKRLEVIPWARRCFPCQSNAPESRAALAHYSLATATRWYSSS